MSPDLRLDRTNAAQERWVGLQLDDQLGVERGRGFGGLLGDQLERTSCRGGADLDRARRRREETRDLVGVADGGREADPSDRSTGERVQPLEGDPELGPPVGADELVHLVHDDRPHVGDRPPEQLPHEQDLERLGRSEQEVGGLTRLGEARGRARVPVAHGGLEPDLLDQGHESMLEVPVQRAQGRDVEDRDRSARLGQASGQKRKERRFGLPRARGRDQQRVGVRLEDGEGQPLDLGQVAEPAPPDGGDETGIDPGNCQRLVRGHGSPRDPGRAERTDGPLGALPGLEVEHPQPEALGHRAPEGTARERVDHNLLEDPDGGADQVPSDQPVVGAGRARCGGGPKEPRPRRRSCRARRPPRAARRSRAAGTPSRPSSRGSPCGTCRSRRPPPRPEGAPTGRSSRSPRKGPGRRPAGARSVRPRARPASPGRNGSPLWGLRGGSGKTVWWCPRWSDTCTWKPRPRLPRKSADSIVQWIRSRGPALVALSGGVDSSLVASLAYEALGERAVAATVSNAALATRESDRAASVARSIGIDHVLLAAEPLDRPEDPGERGGSVLLLSVGRKLGPAGVRGSPGSHPVSGRDPRRRPRGRSTRPARGERGRLFAPVPVGRVVEAGRPRECANPRSPELGPAVRCLPRFPRVPG